ncbi:MAG: DUF481 domain-containing protein [Verrucomicrobia bacterium]|nr:DUF481 domain-containing protein [Verrucomicrobiota bacterium]
MNDYIRLTGIMVGFGALASLAAQEAAPNPTAWKTTATIGAALTRGNSETLSVSGGINTAKKWSQNELSFGTGFAYAEDKDSVTASTITGFGQYNRLFNERLFGFGRVDALHDDVSDIAYRASLSAGLGYYLIKNDKVTLTAEVGPGYVFERIGAEKVYPDGTVERYWDDRDYATIRFGEKFTWQITKTARFWQSLEYTPMIEDWSDYVINAEAGIATKISEHFDLRIVAQDTYRSVPAAGREENDFKLLGQIGYTF